MKLGESLRLFWRSLSHHPGLPLCWMFPALGLLSGVLGHAENHRLERAIAAALALGVFAWVPVLCTAWSSRHQYKGD